MMQNAIRTFLSVTIALRANANVNLFYYLVRPKDPVDPRKQDGVVFKIPFECRKVYVGKTGSSMHEQIKEYNRNVRLSRTQTLAISEHANRVFRKVRPSKTKT